MPIKENVRKLLSELPDGVELVAAAKARTPEEIQEAVEAGVKIIGENYVQEAEKARKALGSTVKWHFIGHLQRNKVRKAAAVFDMIETVDSVEKARELDRRCADIGRIMPVLIEVNSGHEPQKSGVLPADAGQLIREIAPLKNIKVMGLMTMGPLSASPEDSRPCFAETKRIYDHIKDLDLPGVEMKYLSMGMSDSYRVALEEGANMVRIGVGIFGAREEKRA